MVEAPATTMGTQNIKIENPEKGLTVGEPFLRVNKYYLFWTQGSRKLEPWAEISERLRRLSAFIRG